MYLHRLGRLRIEVPHAKKITSISDIKEVCCLLLVLCRVAIVDKVRLKNEGDYIKSNNFKNLMYWLSGEEKSSQPVPPECESPGYLGTMYLPMMILFIIRTAAKNAYSMYNLKDIEFLAKKKMKPDQVVNAIDMIIQIASRVPDAIDTGLNVCSMIFRSIYSIFVRGCV